MVIRELERRGVHRRDLEWRVFVGVVLPLFTIAAVRSATIRWELPAFVPLLVLFALPLLFGMILVGASPWGSGRLGGSAHTCPEEMRDRIPDRYHEEFDVETLNQSVEEDPGLSRRRRFALTYCCMVPALSLALMFL